MKDTVQLEKAEIKLMIIKNLIEQLANYNSITNYSNIKRFTFKIDYYYVKEENCYKYSIKVFRGFGNEMVLDLRLQYKEKLNDLIKQLIEDLLANDKFKYTCYHNEFNINKNYAIILDNEICVEFGIHDEEDKVMYDEIEQKFKTKQVEFNRNVVSLSDSMKDDLQQDKAINIIYIVKNILNSLSALNNVENYDNTKAFRLVVNNNHGKSKDCTKFTFTIFRGTPKIFELGLSIKDTKIVYDGLFDLMVSFMNKKDFLFFTTSNSPYENCLNIYLKNAITLEFSYDSIKDKEFYTAFFNEFKTNVYKMDHKKIGHKLELKDE